MGNSACLAAHHIAPYCIAGEELWVLSDLKDRALGLISLTVSSTAQTGLRGYRYQEGVSRSP